MAAINSTAPTNITNVTLTASSAGPYNVWYEPAVAFPSLTVQGYTPAKDTPEVWLRRRVNEICDAGIAAL